MIKIVFECYIYCSINIITGISVRRDKNVSSAKREDYLYTKQYFTEQNSLPRNQVYLLALTQFLTAKALGWGPGIRLG